MDMLLELVREWTTLTVSGRWQAHKCFFLWDTASRKQAQQVHAWIVRTCSRHACLSTPPNGPLTSPLEGFREQSCSRPCMLPHKDHTCTLKSRSQRGRARRLCACCVTALLATQLTRKALVQRGSRLFHDTYRYDPIGLCVRRWLSKDQSGTTPWQSWPSMSQMWPSLSTSSSTVFVFWHGRIRCQRAECQGTQSIWACKSASMPACPGWKGTVLSASSRVPLGRSVCTTLCTCWPASVVMTTGQWPPQP
jgi:hypothetical protein